MQREPWAINILQKLIHHCRSAQNGYREAAEQTSDQELRAFLTEQSLERAEFASVLQLKVQHLGEPDPTHRPAIVEAARQKWMELKREFSGSDKRLLEAIQESEERAGKDYEAALEQDLPDDLHGVLQQQMETIKAARDHLRLLWEKLSGGEKAA